MKALFIALATISSFAHADDLKQFSPSFMAPGYCHAGSRPDNQAGGYGKSSNAPKELRDVSHGSDGAVSLVALFSEHIPFAEQYRGFKLLLINRTKTEVAFPASDSRLPIICEARDEDGEWRPIEYFPSSFCGNSYHQVYLPAGHYWEFAAPIYLGVAKTKLRFKLQGKQSIYSNEFDGSISPFQFLTPKSPK